ncbi:uncharacterized protein LOC120351993 [Nilaparvata lugens]|uniref:uncharacterized protein LOC120351993 n=1 Tax=Nilaparvata lugens TaxID=108931 RepID=UPI00193D3078|nr:uncharacterized protein LOC120351993 [Nilaparvata lugens]
MSQSDQLDLEVVAVMVPTYHIIVVSLYHSPSGNFDSFCDLFERLLLSLNRHSNNYSFVIAGDFNVNFICDDQKSRYVIELLKSFGLYITCNEPTRGPSCLDNVAVSFQQDVCETKVIDLHGDDHSALVSNFSMSGSSMVSAATPTWHANYVFSSRRVHETALIHFKNDLARTSWDAVFQNPGDSGLLGNFFKFFQEKFDKFFPEILKTYSSRRPQKRQGRMKSHQEWYNDDLAAIKEVMLALKNRCEGGDDGDRRRYRRAKSIYKKQVELARKVATAAKIDNAPNRCKAAWDVINSHRSLPVRKLEFASPDAFNDFFIESVNSIVGELPTAAADPAELLAARVPAVHARLSFFRPITSLALRKIVKSFKPSKSPDVYGMSAFMLREVIEEIVDPLAVAVNDCLRTAIFPDFLKTSRTTPVYKKGDHQSLNSYRPISITPIFGKVVEAVIKPQLEDFFERNNLFSDMQFGFRRGRSTFDAVNRVAERIGSAFEDGESLH